MTSFHRSPANFRSHWIPSPHPGPNPRPPTLHSYPLPLQVKGGHLLGRWGEILIPPHSTPEAVGQNGIDAKQRGKHASITHKALATIFEHTWHHKTPFPWFVDQSTQDPVQLLPYRKHLLRVLLFPCINIPAIKSDHFFLSFSLFVSRTTELARFDDIPSECIGTSAEPHLCVTTI